ncbi:MAG: DNA topoisomerase IV subunit A [Myxococcales bacterium FL481]|nr:MAG: DNA topoisomerase IV subunit A [Myxococcales bacterium FL481]
MSFSASFETSSTAPSRARRGGRGDDGSGGGGGSGGEGLIRADLAEQARRKYLTYALSVITSRAIPDVRDGLKPVHRRILYTMFEDLHLTHDARHRKSAKVVGDVIGRYHPHGDTAVYDAMVRLAQDFAMRMPLVDGQGNFGSIDGDSPAAYRYTEARLTELASELLVELRSKTVDLRANYDGTGFEPTVLPARFPQLLVNGGSGIAVGMATSIPPHNLGEVIKACVVMIDNPEVSVRKLLRSIKGPDFPTGGRLVATRDEIVAAYESGRGSFKLRGEWKLDEGGRDGSTVVMTSVPYGVEKAALVEEIGALIVAKKLPGVIGIQDLSTTDVRVELELAAKGGVDPELIMAYLCKHTRMQVNIKVDMTCLTPTSNPEVSVPARLPLDRILRHFLDFRFATVTRRFEYELRRLEERIHILEGFERIFDDLDRAIRIIRRSDGKADAATKLMKAFELDELQADAVLETRLYRLAKLEIEKIRLELAEKRKRAKQIRAILRSPARLWRVVKDELEELAGKYGDKRRTQVSEDDGVEEFTAESFIVDEDAHVLITRDGWIKRQRNIKLETTRMREGDAVLDVIGGSTRECIVLFSSRGAAYACRINDIPQSTGHGTPVQKLFKMKDGERIVAAATTDSRIMEEFAYDKPELGEEYEEPYPHFLAVTKRGLSLRFALWPHREPSTSRGRLFGKLREGDEFVAVFQVYAEDDVCVVTRSGKLLCCNSQEINMLTGPGKGVTLIKAEPSDEVVSAWPAQRDVELARTTGGKIKLRASDRKRTGRGGKGRPVFARGTVKAVEMPLPQPVDFAAMGSDGLSTRSKPKGKGK